MGAHIGHLHVEASDSISFCSLGTRRFFVVFDLYKTLSFIKTALVFFERVIQNFGNSLFCYSGVSTLNIHIKMFLIQLIKERNQSFSYLKWSPGCITNYQSVFIRLVRYLFRDSMHVWYKKSRHDIFRGVSRYLFYDRFLMQRLLSFLPKKYPMSDSSQFNSFFLRNRAIFLSDRYELFKTSLSFRTLFERWHSLRYLLPNYRRRKPKRFNPNTLQHKLKYLRFSSYFRYKYSRTQLLASDLYRFISIIPEKKQTLVSTPSDNVGVSSPKMFSLYGFSTKFFNSFSSYVPKLSIKQNVNYLHSNVVKLDKCVWSIDYFRSNAHLYSYLLSNIVSILSHLNNKNQISFSNKDSVHKRNLYLDTNFLPRIRRNIRRRNIRRRILRRKRKFFKLFSFKNKDILLRNSFNAKLHKYYSNAHDFFSTIFSLHFKYIKFFHFTIIRGFQYLSTYFLRNNRFFFAFTFYKRYFYLWKNSFFLFSNTLLFHSFKINLSFYEISSSLYSSYFKIIQTDKQSVSKVAKQATKTYVSRKNNKKKRAIVPMNVRFKPLNGVFRKNTFLSSIFKFIRFNSAEEVGYEADSRFRRLRKKDKRLLTRFFFRSLYRKRRRRYGFVNPFAYGYSVRQFNKYRVSFSRRHFRKLRRRLFFLNRLQPSSRARNLNFFARFSIFKVLPSFTSFLLRIFYVTKHKFEDLLQNSSNVVINEDVYFSSVYRRFLLFWRAIIFFKCFKKTVNLPDCLVFINPDNQQAPFNDFSGVNIPVISVADSNSYTDRITYLIPSNDDSIILFLFYFLLFLNACDSAMCNRYVHLC